MFSLWAESDKKYGGLSLSSEDVGQVLAISGKFLSVVSVINLQKRIVPAYSRKKRNALFGLFAGWFLGWFGLAGAGLL